MFELLDLTRLDFSSREKSALMNYTDGQWAMVDFVISCVLFICYNVIIAVIIRGWVVGAIC